MGSPVKFVVTQRKSETLIYDLNTCAVERSVEG